MKIRLTAICLSLLLLPVIRLEPNAGATDPEENESDKHSVMDRNLAFMIQHAESYTGTREADGAALTPSQRPCCVGRILS